MHHLDSIFDARMRAFFCSLSKQFKGQCIFRKGSCVFRKRQLQFQKLKRSPPPTKSPPGLLDHAGDSTLDLAGHMKRRGKGRKREKKEEKREGKKRKREGEVRPEPLASPKALIVCPGAFGLVWDKSVTHTCTSCGQKPCTQLHFKTCLPHVTHHGWLQDISQCIKIGVVTLILHMLFLLIVFYSMSNIT